MKLLIVTPYFYPSVGGVQNYVLNMVRGLKKDHGYEIVIVTTNHETNKFEKNKFEGMALYRLPSLFKLSNTPINPLWRWTIKKIIKAEKPDIINGYTPVPYLADMACRAKGKIPFILTYNNDLTKPSRLGKVLAKLFYLLLNNRTLKKSDSIIALSDYYAQQSPYISKYSEKVHVVPPGVDLDRFNEKVNKTWLRKKYPDKKIVLFVASLSKTHMHKGLDVLLQAVAKVKKTIPDVQLVAVGQGDAIPIYKQMAEELKIADYVDFPGFVSDQDLPKYYAGADVFVLPSINESEGFGMVLAEAEACGTPVIGAKIGGIPYAVVHKKTGLLVEPNSVRHLHDALCKILMDSDVSDAYSMAGPSYIRKNFGWRLQINKTEKAIKATQKSKKMIACVVPTYPPRLGGMELVAQSINKYLAKDGYRVKVITSALGSNKGKSNEAGVEVTRLHAWEVVHTPLIFGLFRHVISLPKGSIVHIHVSQALTPEVAFIAAKLRRLPVVIHMHTDVGPSGLAGKLLPLYKKVFLGFVLRRADRVIALNQSYEKLLSDKYSLSRNLVVVSNGINEVFFSPMRKQSSQNITKILYVGRLSIEKNVNIIIEAVAMAHSALHLDIVGEGALRKKLEKQAALIENQEITFHGRKSTDQLVKFYRGADIFILASSYEGQPTVIIEAMASGTPVIGVNSIGIAETIGQYGFIVEKNILAIANAIDKLTSSQKLRDAFSVKGRKRAEAYRWDASIAKLKEVYNEL